jgi:hypothetical protein
MRAGIAIMLILWGGIMGSSETYGADFSYIEQYKAEAKGLIGEVSKSDLAQHVRVTPGFTESPKEKNLVLLT